MVVDGHEAHIVNTASVAGLVTTQPQLPDATARRFAGISLDTRWTSTARPFSPYVRCRL